MLKILPRYIIREHIGPFFFALIVINSIFILNILFRDLGKFLSKGISLSIIFEFLFLNLAWMIALSVPMAVLTCSIMAFGRLSAENEITAVKASGISLYQIVPPLLILSALLTCGLIWFNNHVLPDFNHQARLLALDIARKKPMINLDPGVIYKEIPNYNILVQKIKDEQPSFSVLAPDIEEKSSVSKVENIIIDDQSEPNVIKTIVADRGELRFGQQTGILQITLYEGELQEVNIQNPESFKRLDFHKHVIKMQLSEAILQRSQSGYRGDREKSAAALLETVASNRARIAERKERINEQVDKFLTKYVYSGYDSTKSFEQILQEHEQLKRQIQSDLNMIDNYNRSVNVNLVEIYKKYSIPTACIVFIFIGLPLGILTRQSGWATAAGLSIGFFLLYWAFLIAGEILADREKVTPFMAMWAPNILVGGFGIYLVVRTIRETTLIDWRPRIRWRSKLHESQPETRSTYENS